MSTTTINGLDPAELNVFVRDTLAEFDGQVNSLARFLPYQEIPDIRYAYSRGIDALVDEASYRAFDAESPIGRRPGAARVTGELLPISRKIPLSEYDSLRLRNAGDDEIVAGVFRDADRLTRGIAARLERARGELLVSGEVDLSENGVVSTYESGRHASLTVAALSSTAKWSDLDDSDPISNIIAWKALVRTQSGLDPNRLIVSPTVAALLQQNDKVRSWDRPLASAPGRVTIDAVNDAFLGLAQVAVEVYEAPAGMTSSPIPANTVVLLRDNVPLGMTAHGMTLEASEPEFGATMQPGVVAGAWKTTLDPIQVWTKAVTIALPLLAAPDLTLSCQVID